MAFYHIHLALLFVTCSVVESKMRTLYFGPVSVLAPTPKFVQNIWLESIGLHLPERCITTNSTAVVKGIRLVEGEGRYAGRLEVWFDGSWGTVCCDDWRIQASHVACRQLGFAGAIPTEQPALDFGSGSGPIHLARVVCAGNETDLWGCENVEIGSGNCNHAKDTGIVCTPSVRLADGAKATEGRVEVYWKGSWGTVCDKNWELKDAAVICRQLDLGHALEALRRDYFVRNDELDVLIDDVGCHGNEETVFQCPYSSLENADCQSNQSAGVRCAFEGIRLVGGTTPYEGRIELFANGIWGSVCGVFWSMSNAHVVCRQLGFRGAVEKTDNAQMGSGRLPIHLEEAECIGNEDDLTSCDHYGIGVIDYCTSQDAAAVVCARRVRLIGGSKPTEGRVEVFWEGSWGTVCDDNWDLNDANVVCRELDLGGALEAPGAAYFRQGVGMDILLDDVACVGNEETVFDCPHNGIGNENCNHRQDAGVKCNSIGVRLVGGRFPTEGRLEVFLDNVWGSVCNTYWKVENERVVCTQLGYSQVDTAPSSTTLGNARLPFHLDAVTCSGTETDLLNCSYSAGDVACYLFKAAVVGCA